MTSPYDREKLEAELSRDEGRRYSPYMDTRGHWTAGVGHNLDAHGIDPNSLPDPIPDATIDQWLAEDIGEAEASLNTHAPWWTNLSDVRERVILNMCFNLGWGKLGAFHKMLAALEAGQFGQAATEMLNSAWAGQVGQRAQRLAAMMRAG